MPTPFGRLNTRYDGRIVLMRFQHVTSVGRGWAAYGMNKGILRQNFMRGTEHLNRYAFCGERSYCIRDRAQVHEGLHFMLFGHTSWNCGVVFLFPHSYHIYTFCSYHMLTTIYSSLLPTNSTPSLPEFVN